MAYTTDARAIGAPPQRRKPATQVVVNVSRAAPKVAVKAPTKDAPDDFGRNPLHERPFEPVFRTKDHERERAIAQQGRVPVFQAGVPDTDALREERRKNDERATMVKQLIAEAQRKWWGKK